MKNNSRFVKVAVSAGLVVCSGAAVLGLTSFASAKINPQSAAVVQVDDTTTSTDSTVAESSDSTAVSPATTAPASSTNDDTARPSPLATAAKALGITEAELVAQLQAGKSISDVAKDRNVDLADVKAALLKDVKAHLDAEVASGEHTQAEADAKYEEMKSRIDSMLTQAGLPRHGGHRGPGGHEGMGKDGHGPRFASDALAKVLKMTATELNTELRAGKSLADIAKAQGVDIDDVKAVLVSDFKAHLDEEVTSGEHTQAEADAKLAEFKTRLDDMVNGVKPAGGADFGGGHRGHGGRGGHGRHGDDSLTGDVPADQADAQGASFPA